MLWVFEDAVAFDYEGVVQPFESGYCVLGEFTLLLDAAVEVLVGLGETDTLEGELFLSVSMHSVDLFDWVRVVLLLWLMVISES